MRPTPLLTFCLLALLATPLHAASPTLSPLADAVEKQNTKTIASLLKQKTAVNAAQPDGMTALHWAVYFDNLPTAEKLIEAGANVNSQNQYAITPLYLACANGNKLIANLLLAQGADPNAALPGGETLLMTAARTGRLGPVQALLAQGAQVNAKEDNDQTAIMWAAAEGHAEVVSALLKAGADFYTPLRSGYTPLLFAVREGHTQVVQQLILAGAEVNAPMQPKAKPKKGPVSGTSPLILAIENGHYELAVELLKAGADPNDQRTSYAPLHTLSWVRKPDYGDNEAGDPSPIGSGNMTSLQFARELVKHGADVNLPKKNSSGGRGRFSQQGTTPFFCAAGTGDTPFMRVLVELGADPHRPNRADSTPLMLAAGLGTGSSGDDAGTEPERLEAVKFLLNLGADINAINRSGETAMLGAAYKTMPTVVEYLDAQGADIHIWSQKSKDGHTPLSIAQGYRGKGNFKPSFPTVDAIKKVMLAHGVTPPPPPAKHAGRTYK